MVFAQPPDTVWTRVVDSASIDSAAAVSDDGFVMAGGDAVSVNHFAALMEYVKPLSSIVTLIALIWAIVSWRLNIKRSKKAMINALFEEIRHNLVIVQSVFVNEPTTDELNYLHKRLNESGKKAIYPNPTDSKEAQEVMIDGRYFKRYPDLKENAYLVEMRMNSLQDIVARGDAVHLLDKRLFLNIHHLFYSIGRYNVFVHRFNAKVEKKVSGEEVNMNLVFDHGRGDYMMWLHYRLWFTLLDLIKSVPSNMIIDTEFVNKYRTPRQGEIENL
jgi:hypothetical protein